MLQGPADPGTHCDNARASRYPRKGCSAIWARPRPFTIPNVDSLRRQWRTSRLRSELTHISFVLSQPSSWRCRQVGLASLWHSLLREHIPFSLKRRNKRLH